MLRRRQLSVSILLSSSPAGDATTHGEIDVMTIEDRVDVTFIVRD